MVQAVLWRMFYEQFGLLVSQNKSFRKLCFLALFWHFSVIKIIFNLNLTLTPAEGHLNERPAGHQSSPGVPPRATGAPTGEERHFSVISLTGDGAEPEVSVSCQTSVLFVVMMRASSMKLSRFPANGFVKGSFLHVSFNSGVK